jgi:hypothetical protein
MFSSLDQNFNKDNPYRAENYAQLHYAIKTGAPFSREMTRSVKEALKVWKGAGRD